MQSFNLHNPQHTFIAGIVGAGILALASSWLFRRPPPINRYDVESRFTDAIEYGGFVFISGQIGEGDSVEEQTRSALHCVDLALAKAGTDKSRVMECSCYLTDIKDYARMNSVYDEWLVGIKPPTRTVLQVKLFHPVCRVEFKVVAAL